MNALMLARWQFAITTVYHFFFVPLTLGLSIMLAVMETRYVRTGDENWLRMTKFWGRLFLINFAMGVATGIVQEFQFGMNWSEYSRFVGDIFGAPLAIEALLAFFLESTFLGVWIFGWDKLPKHLHAATMWLVAIGSNISAFWILVANSFMHEPTGYVLNEVTGRAEMASFKELILNLHVWHQVPHVIVAGLATAAFFILGISAWHLKKSDDPNRDFWKKSFRMGAIWGTVSVLIVMVIGHAQAQYMVKVQPMKMAASEALWETENPAAFSIISVINEKEQTNSFAIRIPRMLSFLSHNSFSGEVKGIKELQAEFEAAHGPGNYTPPVFLTFWSFRIMVGAGLLMLLVGLGAIWSSFKYQKPLPHWALCLIGNSLFLPYLANSTGWIMTELGRQPWLVYNLMTLEDGVSSVVSAGSVAFSLAVFTLLYGALMVVDVYLLRKYSAAGLDGLNEEEA